MADTSFLATPLGVWTVVGAPLWVGSVARQGVLPLLATTPATEVQTVFDNLVGLGELMQAIGLVLLAYGALGWIGYGTRSRSSRKGKQLVLFGAVFLGIGLNFTGFLRVIKYVFTG